jgi:hypothetical protein
MSFIYLFSLLTIVISYAAINRAYENQENFEDEPSTPTSLNIPQTPRAGRVANANKSLHRGDTV